MPKKNFKDRIEGKFTVLKAMLPEHFEYIIQWRNDKRVNRFLNQKDVLTYESQKKWYEAYLQREDDITYVIYDREKDRAFGTIGLTNVNRNEGHCIQGRFLSGDTDYLGGVYVADAYLALINYVFGDLGLDRCYCHVMVENKRAVSNGKHFGYVESKPAKFPQYLFSNGVQQVEYVLTEERYMLYSSKIRGLINHYEYSIS